jgi:acetyl-CoA acetyltransferase
MTAEAVIVTTARTPMGKAFRGAFNNTHGAVMAGHAIEHAVARAGIEPLGVFRGFAVAGCEPDEMGIGPVFTVQVIYCRDRLGISMERLNVDGGSIAVGGRSGSW